MRDRKWKLGFVEDVVVSGIQPALMKCMVLVGGLIKIERCVVTVFMVLIMNLVRQKFITDQVVIRKIVE